MNFGTTSSTRPLSDVFAFFDELRSQYASDSAKFKDILFSIDECICKASFLSLENGLRKIAGLLHCRPKLFRALNSLLDPGFSIEVDSFAKTIRYFVFMTPWRADIILTSDTGPSIVEDTQIFLISDDGIQKLLSLEENDAWRQCVAQILQYELEKRTCTDRSYRRRIHRWLQRLAKETILPPSLFLSFVNYDPNPSSGGGYSDIHKGDIGDQVVCVKVLRTFLEPAAHAKRVAKKFACEALVWKQLKHPNVLPFLGTYKTGSKFCLVSPWMANGNIMVFLSHNPDHSKLQSIVEIAAGIEYLHSRDPPIIHQDIKGANIMVKDDLVCCLADFGISAIVHSQRLNTSTGVPEGTMHWLAPEEFQSDSCELEVCDSGPTQGSKKELRDIFAFGCTIFEIMTGKPPLHQKTGIAAIFAVVKGEREELPPSGDWAHEELKLWPLVDQCWKGDPLERPSSGAVCETLRGIRYFPSEYSYVSDPEILPVSRSLSLGLPVTHLSEIKKQLEQELALLNQSRIPGDQSSCIPRPVSEVSILQQPLVSFQDALKYHNIDLGVLSDSQRTEDHPRPSLFRPLGFEIVNGLTTPTSSPPLNPRAVVFSPVIDSSMQSGANAFPHTTSTQGGDAFIEPPTNIATSGRVAVENELPTPPMTPIALNPMSPVFTPGLAFTPRSQNLQQPETPSIKPLESPSAILASALSPSTRLSVNAAIFTPTALKRSKLPDGVDAFSDLSNAIHKVSNVLSCRKVHLPSISDADDDDLSFTVVKDENPHRMPIPGISSSLFDNDVQVPLPHYFPEPFSLDAEDVDSRSSRVNFSTASTDDQDVEGDLFGSSIAYTLFTTHLEDHIPNSTTRLKSKTLLSAKARSFVPKIKTSVTSSIPSRPGLTLLASQPSHMLDALAQPFVPRLS